MQCLCDNTTTINCATVDCARPLRDIFTMYPVPFADRLPLLFYVYTENYVKIKCILTVGGPGAAVEVIVSSGMYLSQLLNVTLSPRFWARKEK